MASTSDVPLSNADRAMLSIRADQFHDALSRGFAADWSPFLEGLTGQIRFAVLAELAVIEMGHRWDLGEQPGVAEYIERYPELGPIEEAPPALLKEYERCSALASGAAMATQRSKRPPEAEAATHTVRASGTPPVVLGGPGGEGVVAIAQQYDLVRELGRGAFGEVWLARKQPSGIEKAVKILHQPADQDVSQREFRALELIKNLRHPYLLATEDFWVANNRLYIVSELADYSLRKRLVDCKEDGLPGIPADELFNYMLESAEGLDYLHSKMVTHRDVKPDNILILNGHAKVADFGLARQHDTPVAAMSFAGTPAYMAPEVWGGEGGPLSDLYGFALAYVELRQGAPPFKFGRVMEVMQAHLSGQFEFAECIPEAERAVIRRALSRAPEDRHPTCIDFMQEIGLAMGRSIRRSGKISTPRLRALPSPVDEPTGEADTEQPVVTVRAGKAEDLVAEAPPSHRKLALIGAGIVLLGAVAVAAMQLGGGKPSGNGGTDSHLPRGTKAEPGAETFPLADGRQLPLWVVAERGGETARFRLFAPSGAAGTTRPFYILESKVWNRLHRGNDDQRDDDDLPVMNITASDAAKFSATAFEGRLPAPDEWDHAAGFHDRGIHTQPLLPSGVVQLKADKPGPTHGPGTADARNHHGLVDLAGNGREWTCGVLTARDPLTIAIVAEFQPRDLVVLRGRNYTLPTPLTYDILQKQQTDPQTQFADAASPYTGFRVVLPLPE